MKGLDLDICEFKGPYAFLSNFYPSEVEFDGIVYPTVEHAYQAAKTLNPEERTCIRDQPTPAEARRAGRRVAMRENWDSIKLWIMAFLVQQKFSRHEMLRKRLLSTGDRYLEEGNRHGDTFWGAVRGRGHNWLGKILMNVRGELSGRDQTSI